jgi:hypothetical protein
MNLDEHRAWIGANQAWLMAAIAQVRTRVDAFAAGSRPSGHSVELNETEMVFEADAESMSEQPALERLRGLFNLSSFERDVLLACAGVELDSACARSCAGAQAQGGANPTFALLLAALPNAHWDAVSPASPLRRWRLLEMGTGPTLTTSPLRIDERILHFLTGTSYLDQRLEGMVEAISHPRYLPASQLAIAMRAAELRSAETPSARTLLIEINGADQGTRQSVAAHACRLLNRRALRVLAAALPANHAEIQGIARLIDRECLLSHSAVLLDASGEDAHDSARRQAVHLFAQAIESPIVVSSRQRVGGYLRDAVYLDVAKPLMEEQRSAWQVNLGPVGASLNGHVDSLVEQFNFTEEQIRLSSLNASADDDPGRTFHSIWDQCRMQARPQLDSLAQRVETSAGWDALVLPRAQMEILESIAKQMRHRSRVYGGWGFGAASMRGLGITALFSGASGTGKTTAAEILAHELNLDLYRIDLSQVVSKYIGETEKSLRRIFDAAEDGGSLLFFDEADALFGKRTEVKDSHDRYANIEVSYLLQRMEQYRGLAVLATNMKQALDSAFLRRIRFVVHFPFPDATLREQIWMRSLPREAPTENVDVKQLARLCVAGGNIRNIALGAAFLAAEVDEPIRMTHLLKAARGEYLKIEKPLTEAEIRGWL